jgi:hypothetical protein
MDFVLGNGLLCMIPMTMVYFDYWSHVIFFTLFDLDAWFLEDVLHDDTFDIEHYLEDVAHFMQSVAPFDYCTYLGALIHTSWTLDIGWMSIDIADIAKWAIKRAGSPT